MKCHVCKAEVFESTIIANDFICECPRLFRDRANLFVKISRLTRDTAVFYNLMFEHLNNVYMITGRSLKYDAYEFVRFYILDEKPKSFMMRHERFIFRLNKFQPISFDNFDVEANLLFDKLYKLSLFI